MGPLVFIRIGGFGIDCVSVFVCGDCGHVCTYTQGALYQVFITLILSTYWSSAAVPYPLKRFDALCVQRCSSAYHCCNIVVVICITVTFLSALNSAALSLLTSHVTLTR